MTTELFVFRLGNQERCFTSGNENVTAQFATNRFEDIALAGRFQGHWGGRGSYMPIPTPDVMTDFGYDPVPVVEGRTYRLLPPQEPTEAQLDNPYANIEFWRGTPSRSTYITEWVGTPALFRAFEPPAGATMMTIDTSRWGGDPVLQERTNAVRDVEFESTVISRRRIELEGGDLGEGTGNVEALVRVEMDRYHDFVFDCNLTGLLPEIEIHRYDGLTCRLIFRGRARRPVRLAGSSAVFDVLSLYDAALIGLYQNVGWQHRCNWALYDVNTCRVNKTNFRISRTIAGLARGGLRVTLNEAPTRAAIKVPELRILGNVWRQAVDLPELTADNFVGGLVKRQAGGNARKIIGVDGSTLILENPLIVSLDERDADPDAKVAVGNVLEVLAGCDRSIETCSAVFDNEPNFGGYPTIPERSPSMTDYGLKDCFAPEDSAGDRPATRDPTAGGGGGNPVGDRFGGSGRRDGGPGRGGGRSPDPNNSIGGATRGGDLGDGNRGGFGF